MKSDMLWCYLIHFGANMWGDEDCAVSRCQKYNPQLMLNEDVWKQVTNYLPEHGMNSVLIDIGEGIQYETHPELAVPGAWTKDRFKAELNRLRSIGLMPLPKLNFSTTHDAWLGEYSRMISTKKYYQVCADLIQEVCELFDSPEYFHLGMDEENYFGQRFYNHCDVRQGDLWWEDLYFYFDECEKHGARPWIWSDKCERRTINEFVKKMPKSALQSFWYYDELKKTPDGKSLPEYEAYELLDDAGYDQIPTSSTWSRWFNTMETMQFCYEKLSPKRVKGFMTAPWASTNEESLYALLTDAQRFGDARAQVFSNESKKQ